MSWCDLGRFTNRIGESCGGIGFNGIGGLELGTPEISGISWWVWLGFGFFRWIPRSYISQFPLVKIHHKRGKSWKINDFFNEPFHCQQTFRANPTKWWRKSIYTPKDMTMEHRFSIVMLFFEGYIIQGPHCTLTNSPISPSRTQWSI